MRIKLKIKKKTGRWWFYWTLFDDYHKVNSPAYQTSLRTKFWYLFGKHHNEAGPAIIYSDGYKEFWIQGTRIK